MLNVVDVGPTKAVYTIIILWPNTNLIKVDRLKLPWIRLFQAKAISTYLASFISVWAIIHDVLVIKGTGPTDPELKSWQV